MIDTPAEKALEIDDGRNIDASLGELRGEGSTMLVEAPEHAYPTTQEIAQQSTLDRTEQSPTYYGEPVLKEPVWIWSVPLYFFVGGAAGATSAIAAIAEAIAPRDLHALIRRAHVVSAIGDVMSAGLLIHDLGRPSRFLNMLRVFRPTSPMSVGSWVLSASGAAGALAVILGERRGALGRIGRIAGYASGALGLPLAGYTAVLLANTAVPVWQGGRRAMPPLFLASSAASAGAILDLMAIGRRGHAVARRFAIIGAAATLASAAALEREVATVHRVARPLHAGPSGAIWSIARALTAGGLVLSIAPRRRSRARPLANLMLLAGSLGVRAAIFLAGKASARDPRATFQQQRGGASGRGDAASSLPP